MTKNREETTLSNSRKIDYNLCRAQIISAHRDNHQDSMTTVHILDEFDIIYKNTLYNDEFVDQSVKMHSKGLRLDRTSALAWLSSDDSEFEEHVIKRNQLGQTDEEISWIYGVDIDSINDIINNIGKESV